MADRHKNTPLRFRPPEPERLWLAAYQEHSGKPMNAILTEAVRVLRTQVTAAWNEERDPEEQDHGYPEE